MTQAQIRAALGLPPTTEELLLQQHQHQQRNQDAQLRQFLLQDQLEHQLQQEQQLRSLAEAGIGGDIRDTDLQYRWQLEQLEQQQRMRKEAQAQQIQQYEEDVRRQQQLLALQQRQTNTQQHQNLGALEETQATEQAMAAALQREQQLSGSNLYPSAGSRDELDAANSLEAMLLEAHSAGIPEDVVLEALRHREQQQREMDLQVSQHLADQAGKEQLQLLEQQRILEQERILELETQLAAARQQEAMDISAAERKAALETPADKKKKPSQNAATTPLDSLVEVSLKAHAQKVPGTLEQIAAAAEMVEPEIVVKGTLDDLLAAARDDDKIDDAAETLTRMTDTVEWSESESEPESERDSDTQAGLKMPTTPAEIIDIGKVRCELPNLPEEPVTADEVTAFLRAEEVRRSLQEPPADFGDDMDTSGDDGQPTKKKVSAVLEYPYPVDSWWPSTHEVERERHQTGEITDEDDFVDVEYEKGHNTFRANAPKICRQLAASSLPGVLEKLPHCRLHRLRSLQKKDATTEMVFCCQVAHLYPNEVMVNCKKCGTWRHATCGGHHEPYSARKNLQEPFQAICENCHEEARFLKDYPEAEPRLEKQRTEHIRRGLATTAVIRQAALSQVNSNMDAKAIQDGNAKAAKEWSDLTSRLERASSYRSKERTRMRSEELKKLLTYVESAEAHRDVHNMMLFLMRDTSREKPVGFEREVRNIFDPSESDRLGDHPPCLSCPNKRRFDSVFCSDACGVKALELDLLRSLKESRHLRPSPLGT